MSSSFYRFVEDQEMTSISEFGARSFDQTLTARKFSQDNDGYRTPFQRDRDRIIHSRAFRRLMHKTQVFVSPDSDHLRTRLTHSLEVMQIARTIARCLHANEDLTEAIALGHDLGHTPFGHKGQDVVKERLRHYGNDFDFAHAVQSWRIVTALERDRYVGGGLNLTSAVQFGVLRHSGHYRDPSVQNVTVWNNNGTTSVVTAPQTLEEQIVRISDDIAWVNHDWEDGVRSGVLSNSFLSNELLSELGGTELRDRVDAMVRDVIDSYEPGGIPALHATKASFDSLHERVDFLLWRNPTISTYSREAEHILRSLFDFFMEYPENLPSETKERRRVSQIVRDKQKLSMVVGDYITGMTDDWCLRNYQEYIYSPYSQTEGMVLKQPFTWVCVDGVHGDTITFDSHHNWHLPKGTTFSVYHNAPPSDQMAIAHCRINKRDRVVCNHGEACLVHKGDVVLLDAQQNWRDDRP